MINRELSLPVFLFFYIYNDAYTMNLFEQKEVFTKLESSTFEGVPGAYYLPSSKEGPAVTISVCTHGNEPVGLAAAQFLFSFFSKNILKRGDVLLLLNNIEATRRYLEAKTNEERRYCRFVDCNMNRLPDDLFENTNETRYEILRARELLPLWRRSAIALDIHSTSQDSDPMLIAIGGKLPVQYIQGFPITKVVSNIDVVMNTNAVVEFYGNEQQSVSAFGIECGGHEHRASYERAVDCVSALLINLDMIEMQHKPFSSDFFEEYVVDFPLFFPDASYELTRVFKNFEMIQKGEVIAKGDGDPVVAPYDCHVLFAPNTKKPTHISEEVMFLTLPVRAYKH